MRLREHRGGLVSASVVAVLGGLVLLWGRSGKPDMTTAAESRVAAPEPAKPVERPRPPLPDDPALAAVVNQIVARSEAMRPELRVDAQATAGLLLLAAGETDRARALATGETGLSGSDHRQRRLVEALQRFDEGLEPVLDGQPYALEDQDAGLDLWWSPDRSELMDAVRAAQAGQEATADRLFGASLRAAREPLSDGGSGVECWSGDKAEERRLDEAAALASVAKAMISAKRQSRARTVLDEARTLAESVTPVDWETCVDSHHCAPLYGQAKVLGEIGEGYALLGDFPTARKLADLALPPGIVAPGSGQVRSHVGGPLMHRADLLASIGRAQMAAGDTTAALQTLDDSLRSLPGGSDGEGAMVLSGVRLNVLGLMLDTNQIDRAKDWVASAGCGEEGSPEVLAAYLARHDRSREALAWALSSQPRSRDEDSSWCGDHLFIGVVEVVAWLALNGEAPLSR